MRIEPSFLLPCSSTRAKTMFMSTVPPRKSGSATFFEGSCSGKSSARLIFVGLLTMKPTWPPPSMGLASTMVEPQIGSSSWRFATRSIVSPGAAPAAVRKNTADEAARVRRKTSFRPGIAILPSSAPASGRNGLLHVNATQLTCQRFLRPFQQEITLGPCRRLNAHSGRVRAPDYRAVLCCLVHTAQARGDHEPHHRASRRPAHRHHPHAELP